MSALFLENASGERYLHEINRRAFAEEPAEAVFERRLDADFDRDDTLYVVIGTDSGLLVEHLGRRRLGEGSALLFVEADAYRDEIVAELHRRGDGALLESPARLALVAARDWQRALEPERLTRYAQAGRVLVVESLGCRSDHAGCYASLLREVRLALTERMHLDRARLRGKLFVERQLENLADNHLPASLLRGVGDGHVAVVLGGGPSLDRHIDWVLANRERLCVFAASRLSARLDEIGLVPDVVVAVDPQDILYDVSKRALRWEGVPLVAAYHVVPRLLQEWRGPAFYLGSRLPWGASNGEDADNIAVTGSTVSHVAAWVAHEWGFSRILLAGVDLCYAPGGGTHASGSLEAMLATLPSYYDAQVVTYDGRVAGTSLPLKHGVADLERIGATVNAQGARLFNLAADAARIGSVPCLDAAELSLPEGRTRPAFGAAPPLAPGEHLERVLRESADACRRYAAIRTLCRKARHALDGLHGRGGRTAPDHRFKRRLDGIERRLEKEHGAHFALIKRFAAQDFARIMPPSGFEAMDEAQIEAWGRAYYRIVHASAARLGALAASAGERARTRLLELESSPDPDRLLERWTREGTPGRLLLHEGALRAEADAATRERIDGARRAFLESLDAGDTGYARALETYKRDPQNLLRTVRFLFQHENVEDLRVLAAGLPTLESPFPTFGEFARGLVAEHDGRVDEALDRYRGVIDALGARLELGEALGEALEALLEDTLVRVNHLHLALGDADSAERALALLAGLSPAYSIPHAKLLALSERGQEAAEVLQRHVEAHPRDWRAMRELGEVYAGCGAGEAARLAEELARRVRAEMSATTARRVA